MARRATIQLKVHGTVVQSIPLEAGDIEVLLEALWLHQKESGRPAEAVRHRARLIDLLQQIRIS